MSEINTELIWLNKVNGADLIADEYHKRVMNEFEGDLYGAVLGSCYGGELESMAKTWGDRGKVYGFDVFEDLHPRHLSEDPVNNFDATCMEHWYQESVFGTEKLHIDYQRQMIKDLKLDTITLTKGEVHKDSFKDIPKLHYAFLDMDLPVSMINGYSAVRDKIVSGGYLLLHDTQNIPGVGEWYKKEVIGTDRKLWSEPIDLGRELLICLKKK